MINKNYYVKDERLRQYVSVIWLLELDGEAETAGKLLANLNGNVIINMGGGFRFCYGDKVFAVSGHHIRFANTHYFKITYLGKVHLLGIQFTPVGLYQLLGVDMAPFVDTVLPLDELLPELNGFIEQHVALAKSGDIEVFLALLETELAGLLLDKNREQSEDVSRIVMYIRKHPNCSMTDLEDLVHLSTRTIERRFKKVVGVPIKKYLKINQVLKLVFSISRTESETIDWAEILSEHGYYDQPHFINDFKKYVGFSPGQYKSKTDLLMDLYGKK